MEINADFFYRTKRLITFYGKYNTINKGFLKNYNNS